MPYENFDVTITDKGNNYSIDVRASNGEKVTENFPKTEIKNLVNNQGKFADDLAEKSRNFKPVKDVAGKSKPEYNQVLYEAAAANFGKQLSDILFRGKILKILGSCEEICRQNKSVLRIRLDLTDVPELAVLPWEYLRTWNDQNFICLNADTTLVRLEGKNVISPINVVLPLKVLVAAAVPKDLTGLNKDAEIEKIRTALAEMNTRSDFPSDVIQIDVVENATFAEVKSRLQKAAAEDDPYHVFHFIGHGDFDDADQKNQRGLLIFEEEDGGSAKITHEDLGQMLQKFHENLRFVFLNACEGSRHSITNSYSSVAAKLMTIAEVPAVLAMQFNISDSAAVRFANAFYKTLATGASLEKAVDDARMEIKIPHNAGEEWATPVFYLRAESGQLFEMIIPQPPEKLESNGHYASVKKNLPNCKLVVFLGMDVNHQTNWRPGRGIPSSAQLCSFLNQTLTIKPPKDSLASLAKYLEITGNTLSTVFEGYFAVTNRLSRLHLTLGELTARITDKLPDKFIDPFHRSLLFVTTTYDSALEKAFEKANVPEYHIVAYRKDLQGKSYFSHRHFSKSGENSEEYAGSPETDLSEQEYTGTEDKFPVILKIPGEISENFGFAITEDDFLEFGYKGFSEFLPNSLIGQINNSSHLYLGYDLQSWTLRLLWDRICRNQNVQYKGSSYAVVFDENTDPNVGFWREKGINRASAGINDYAVGLKKYVLDELP